MHELFDIGASGGQHMQLEEVWVEEAGLERVYHLLSFKLAPAVKDTHGCVLHDSQIAYSV